jgi:hypothetical protein
LNGKQGVRQTDREMDVQVERWTYREMDRHTDIEMGRQQERWTDKNKARERRDTQRDGQTNRNSDEKVNIQSDMDRQPEICTDSQRYVQSERWINRRNSEMDR